MADIGLVGLGVMGSNLALNMAEKGYTVAVHNRTTSKIDTFMANAGPLAERLVPCKTVKELAAAITPPRPIVIMVLAGPPVDEEANKIGREIVQGDMLIDAGNANFRDTQRRVKELWRPAASSSSASASPAARSAPATAPRSWPAARRMRGSGSRRSCSTSPPSSTASPAPR